MDNIYIRIEYEAIDDTLLQEALQQEPLIQVSKEQDYLQAMEEQNKKILRYLQDTHPEKCFKLSKWNAHDFGSYQEVLEGVKYRYCSDCDNLSDDCDCE